MNVQEEPGAPVYAEQSLIKWRSPLRPESADTEATPVLTESVRAATPAISTMAGAKIVVKPLNFRVSFPFQRSSL
jgi:hypothetical protein